MSATPLESLSVRSLLAGGWAAFKSHAGLCIGALLTLALAWAVLEVLVFATHKLGVVVNVALHLGYLVVVPGLWLGTRYSMFPGFLAELTLLNVLGASFLGLGLRHTLPTTLLALADLSATGAVQPETMRAFDADEFNEIVGS